MKFIMKHGKTEKDIHNLRQEIEVIDFFFYTVFTLFESHCYGFLVVKKFEKRWSWSLCSLLFCGVGFLFLLPL